MLGLSVVHFDKLPRLWLKALGYSPLKPTEGAIFYPILRGGIKTLFQRINRRLLF